MLAPATPRVPSAAGEPKSAEAPLRVLFVAGFCGDERTGAGNAVHSLAGALRARGHAVDLWFAEDFTAAVTAGRRARLLFPIAAARRIQREAVHYDVIVLHEPSAMPYLLARKWNAALPPCVVMSHGVEQHSWDLHAERTPRSLKARLFHPLTELAQANYSLRHADAVVCLSNDDAEYLEQRLGVSAARIHRISNGVDARRFTPHWSVSAQPGLVFVGSWIPRKGTQEFVKAFAELRRSRPDLRASVLGAGLSVETVRKDFAAADRESVSVVPSVSRHELPTLLARDQIFVLPSHFEGMPLTLLEAMATGLPCVTTNICGMRDVVAQGTDGFLISPGDTAALVATLNTLLASSELRRRIGNAARQSAEKRTWERCAGEIAAVLQQVAGSKPRRFVLQEGRWSDQITQDPGERLAGVLVKLGEDLQQAPNGFREMEDWNDYQIAGRILDLGCGTGWKAAHFQRERSNSVVAVDRDSRLLEFGRKKFGVQRLVEGDACALPFPSATFDWVLAVEVVEHLERPDLFFHEIHRVLRPGGKLLLTTPNRLQYLRPWHPRWFYRALRGRMMLEPSHVREFTVHELAELLPAGLEIECQRYRGTLCGRPLPVAIESVPQPFRRWWAQGIELVMQKAVGRAG